MYVEVLNENHNIQDFDCGDQIYNSYLKQQALGDLNSFYSKTYVLVSKETGKVIAFYTLISSQLTQSESSFMLKEESRLPALLLGKLAVDRNFAGRNIASDLCVKAFRDLLFLCKYIGYVAIIVDAATDSLAEKLYKPQGFLCLNNKPRRLYRLTTELLIAMEKT